MRVSAEVWPSVVGVATLTVVTLIVLLATRTPHPFAPARAILRGIIQLTFISVILAGVITDPRWVAVALVVMFGVASGTAARRLGDARMLPPVAGAMAAGVAVTGVIVFASGALQLTPRYALAIGGIVIGNAMTIATLAGRRFRELVDDRWEEVEGWMSLGARPRQSTVELARRAVYTAIIPSTDQTKTTGLVTLPGAFVGAIFGGVSPLEAGRFQIVVLTAIMAAGAITAALVVAVLAPVTQRPAQLH